MKGLIPLIDWLEALRWRAKGIAGARQTGKNTLLRQVLEGISGQGHYATADEPTLKDRSWIEQQWEAGRRLANAKRVGDTRPARQSGPAPAVCLDRVRRAL